MSEVTDLKKITEKRPRLNYFNFLESAYTYHQLTNVEEHFSYIRDGEQKASQAYIWFFRKVCKYMGIVSLPFKFLLCFLRINPFPESAKVMIERAIKAGEKKAKEIQAAQIKKREEEAALTKGERKKLELAPGGEAKSE